MQTSDVPALLEQLVQTVALLCDETDELITDQLTRVRPRRLAEVRNKIRADSGQC